MKTTEKIFHIFGDESQFSGAITYGLVIVATKAQQDIENKVGQIKKDFGLQANDKIHCREIFNEQARQKTALKHLLKGEIFDLLGKLLTCCNGTDARLWVGHVNSADAPGILIFEGKDKTKITIQKWDIRDMKVKMSFAYQAAMAPVLHVLGHDDCRAWVDGDKSKIAQLMGSKQANTSKIFFPIDHKDEQFVPIPVKENKPPLIEIADILAYAAAHHLSATHTKDKYHYDSLLNHNIGYSEVLFDGPGPQAGAYMSVRVPDNHKDALTEYAKNWKATLSDADVHV